ncbi:DUF523 domain-containing protein [Desulforamulus aeronauticus]|uniref:Uncharacterized conserved protein YbbK, DUF523 family n=1 Tax=Desulforamulus aeronauticus DSM 10349 TaxID=1121421 RepID=A0A1M6VSP9_9FIRM|nr:DUF523 domain-containing protein [Desulforamulus aeronauticus]SHK84355.1 Uncharacterized conserved protein YbbK, DUF523 family [Desulforamulus aeronauticus DSM 10349]
MILVSACLAGIPCKYHGGDNLIPEVLALVEQGKAIAVCPEELGGLLTPREPVDIETGDGFQVLAGHGRCLCEGGREVTAEFVQGAEKVLQIALEKGITLAILKERSPSCGSSRIYNRVPSALPGVERRVVEGMGVTAALLNKNGIKVISEEQIDQGIFSKK